MLPKLISPDAVSFEWNQANLTHIQRHAATYNECEDIFYDQPVFFYDDKHSQKEERFLVYGSTQSGRLLVLIFTIRQSAIRIITARDQNRKEKQAYHLNKKDN